MWNSRQLLLGIGASAITLALVSFSDGEENNPTKKRYHVIHQKDGVLQEFDTVLSINSSYTVEDFLTSKGIEADQVKIIQVPAHPADHSFIHKEGDAQQRVFFHRFDDNVTIDGADEQRMEVQITHETDHEGKEVIRKTVNGKEVELSEKEKEDIRNGRSHTVHFQGHREPTEHSESEEVEIRVEVDDSGNVKATKWVNGKEVELSDEELQDIQLHHEQMGNDHMILIEKSLEDVSENSAMEWVEDEEDGVRHVIVKEIVINEEESGDASREARQEIQVMSHFEGDDEDFTIVLVTEEMDGDTDVRHTAQTSRTSLNDPISVYPNPNTSTFTIAFHQSEKVQTSVKVTDINGKVVFKEKLGAFSGDYKKEIDLQRFGTGIYLVNVQQGDEVSVRKVIVE